MEWRLIFATLLFLLLLALVLLLAMSSLQLSGAVTREIAVGRHRDASGNILYPW